MTEPPFGKPFKYTDPSDLGPRRPWWRRLLRRRLPVGWMIEGDDWDDNATPQAHMMVNGEVKVSPIEPGGMLYPIKSHDQFLNVAADIESKDDEQ